jgi:hypothetical protein
MGKQFDEFAKALASGVSRREALRRLAASAVGGAFAAIVSRPGAEAYADPGLTTGPNGCHDFCGQDGLSGRAYGGCIEVCAACRKRGGRIMRINGGLFCVEAT